MCFSKLWYNYPSCGASTCPLYIYLTDADIWEGGGQHTQSCQNVFHIEKASATGRSSFCWIPNNPRKDCVGWSALPKISECLHLIIVIVSHPVIDIFLPDRGVSKVRLTNFIFGSNSENFAKIILLRNSEGFCQKKFQAFFSFFKALKFYLPKSLKIP